MSAANKNSKFSFNIPLATTIIILSFFLIFKGALSQLISGGDCLRMEFFGSKINTCEENATKQILVAEQEEIADFVKSLKSTIDSLEMLNNGLHSQVITLESKLANDNTAAVGSISADGVLSNAQRAKYNKYTKSVEQNTKD